MDSENSQLLKIIKGCKRNDRSCQEDLYRKFFSYGLTVSLHYTNDRAEAEDVLNEGFYKVFKKIDQFDENENFKPWFRKLLVNTAIDYVRKYNKLQITEEILYAYEQPQSYSGLDKLQLDDLLKMLQSLPNQYRLVFNLYVMEGFSHEEIGEKLGIGTSTSKSNLSRAKAILRKGLEQEGVKFKKA